MQQALNTAGTGMVAQQYNLDVISNNLANVNTTAFKAQRAEFQDLMYQTLNTAGIANPGSPAPPQPTQVGLGAQFAATATDFSPGPLQTTSNPMDLAINGQGFFRVLRPDGTNAYTRDGSFKVDSSGNLVTSDGLALQPAVNIPQGATSVSISADGTISYVIPGSNDTVTVPNAVSVTTFTNPGALQRTGQNLFIASQAAGSPQEGKPGDNGAGTLQSGTLEGSNVQVVEEMVKMIMAQRAYEINSKAITTSDQMLSTVNNLKQ